MISKKHRLKELEVKKVLQLWKPFFSFWIVLNYKNNKLWVNRFAIVIWWKSVKWSVERNFFRRMFYDLCNIDLEWSIDFVFVLKKQTKLDKNNMESINSFKKDIKFLFKKVIN